MTLHWAELGWRYEADLKKAVYSAVRNTARPRTFQAHAPPLRPK